MARFRTRWIETGLYKTPAGLAKVLSLKSANRLPMASEKHEPIVKIRSEMAILTGERGMLMMVLKSDIKIMFPQTLENLALFWNLGPVNNLAEIQLKL